MPNPMPPFQLSSTALKRSLDLVAVRDPELKAALAATGYPKVRRRPQGFGTLLRIVVGQQLSTKAAATIYARLEAALAPLTSEALLALSSDQLRRLGLSRQKVVYCRGLAHAIEDGSLKLRRLPHLSDDAVTQQLTQLSGFGVWSAQMYLMFALGRPDVWPADDLGVNAAVTRLKGLVERPSKQELQTLGEPWRPHRSAVALFAWHYLSNAPA